MATVADTSGNAKDTRANARETRTPSGMIVMDFTGIPCRRHPEVALNADGSCPTGRHRAAPRRIIPRGGRAWQASNARELRIDTTQ